MATCGISIRVRYLDVDSSDRRDIGRSGENRLEGDHVEVGQTKSERSVSGRVTSYVGSGQALYHHDLPMTCLQPMVGNTNLQLILTAKSYNAA